jgi:bacteriocin biosynthesis docking scaffold, sagD family
MLKFYSYFLKNYYDFAKISGNRTGILNQTQIPISNHDHDIKLKSITGSLPSYHQQVVATDSEVNYHIIGYSNDYGESLARYTGESVERYAGITSHIFFDGQIIYESYENFSQKNNTIPFELIQVFSPEQIKRQNDFSYSACEKIIERKDIIGWVKCYSLFNKGEIYVPAQMLLLGYLPSQKENEYLYVPSFSTGTASHRSFEKALENALIEYIQIDSMMISWYTSRKCKRIIIDDNEILTLLEKCNLGKDSPYEVIPIEMTIDSSSPVHTFGVILKNKKGEGPNILFGVQGGLNPKKTIIRGIMEAASISYGFYYNMLYNNAEKKNILSDNPRFLDLDSNVFYYSHPKDGKKKWKIFDELISSETVMLSELNNNEFVGLKGILEYLKSIAPNSVILNITPPELDDKNWHVLRILCPDLLEMCIPDFPFKNHPRMKKYGGVKNRYAHPLP